ncbi:MAG: division/cell wall cluster transcriptional repressor MraZ [Planctomycetota bacterium]
MLLTGKYEHSIDAKQRLAIPADLRAQLEKAGDAEAMYVSVGPNGAIWLWPERVFERLAGDIEPSLAPPDALMTYDEITFPETQRRTFDKTGRLVLPPEMLAECDLGPKVLIVGMRNHLELHEPEDWERRRQERQTRRADIVQGARPYLAKPPRRGETDVGS